MRSFHKLDMASAEWLTTHFLAKSAYRAREVGSLGIWPGARILDLCCGSGLFMALLLDFVGPTGHVTGVDQDPQSLDAAHARLIAQPHKTWTLRHARLEDTIDQVREFDIILLFNCIGYFERPEDIVRRLAASMKPGAVLIVKDFDLEGFFFQPREIGAWATLLQRAKTRNDTDNPVSFDNFFGRRVHALHRVAPLRSYSCSTWTQLMTYPFSPMQVEYIWRNIECLIQQAGPECPSDVVNYFKGQFYPPEPEFFANPLAMFVETEYLISMTV